MNTYKKIWIYLLLILLMPMLWHIMAWIVLWLWYNVTYESAMIALLTNYLIIDKLNLYNK